MATATKKENKSAQIREYAKAHPKATATEIAEHVGCSVALVHNVRNRKPKGKRKAKGGRPTSIGTHTGNGSSIMAAAKLIHAAGGLAEAKAALATAGEIAKAITG